MKAKVCGFPVHYPDHASMEDGLDLYWVGTIHPSDAPSSIFIKEALIRDGVLKKREDITAQLARLKGNFALVLQDRKGQVLAIVDKIRSFPLFYGIRNDTLYIGGDPHEVRGKIGIQTKNKDAIMEFSMSGYVTGGKTLYEGVQQLEAGQCLYFDGVQMHVEDYYLFYHSHSVDIPQEALIDILHKTTVSIFEKLIKRLQGRPVWIPLSGGLDSRLVVCMLKYLGYDNIQTFSYGVRDLCEAKTAKEIAQRLGVPWIFFHYTRALGRRVFYSELGQQFSRFAHMLSDIPVMMDFYALCELKWKNRIPQDAVFINGQTGDFISGNHIPELLNQESTTKENFFESIIQKHYSLWDHLLTDENRAIISQRIEHTLPLQLKNRMDKEYAMKLYELWEWRNRQAHQVIIDQRAYDFFGLSWELPLWDNEYLEFWSSIPFQLKFRQQLYRDYLNTYDFFGLFKNVAFRRWSVPCHMTVMHFLFTIFGSKKNVMERILLPYWENYAYNYAFLSYREYIRYARHHRNPLSFRVKYLLEKEYGERIFPL